ncbi:MAG: GDP-mannose 4,6-dehydratase [Actinomycetota bacterium]|nr:GDP-mannose 4,6-dehydratase [Actinomycetota bacterium]
MTTNYWRHKNVFVTGCSGLLGSWLTKRLVDEGANVTGLIRDVTPDSYLYLSGTDRRINVVNGAVEDYLLLERALGEYEVDTIFHLAAQTIVGIANRNPLSTFESNIKGTWCLLEAARRSPTIKKAVVASSDKAYGRQETLPYTEEAPLIGQHPYDVSKSCADLIAKSYFLSFSLPVCVTRCGNFYGGGDLNFNRLVPGTIRSVLSGEPPVIRSDGSYVRDYFYVEDAVDAYLHLAAAMDDPAIHGEAFNFSNELQISVSDMTKRILEVMGSDLKPKILAEAKNEIPHQYLSAAKAKRLLGWRLESDLAANLEKTVAWYKAYFDGDLR